MYWNVDDLIFDSSRDIVRGIVSCVTRDLSNISKEKFNEWCDKLWDFDVTTWKPHTDDRAFPGTNYSNKLRHVLESKAYDLKDEIMEYLGIKSGEYFSFDDILTY
jgi:hypothetical protein